MCDKDKSSIGFGVGLLLGVIGGIVAGILYAPKPGEEMREKVKDTVCDLAEKYSSRIIKILDGLIGKTIQKVWQYA